MTAEKDVQVARKKGRGEGGEVIWAMPERKHFFFHEVFPKCYLPDSTDSVEELMMCLSSLKYPAVPELWYFCCGTAASSDIPCFIDTTDEEYDLRLKSTWDSHIDSG